MQVCACDVRVPVCVTSSLFTFVLPYNTYTQRNLKKTHTPNTPAEFYQQLTVDNEGGWNLMDSIRPLSVGKINFPLPPSPFSPLSTHLIIITTTTTTTSPSSCTLLRWIWRRRPQHCHSTESANKHHARLWLWRVGPMERGECRERSAHFVFLKKRESCLCVLYAPNIFEK